MNDDIHNFDGTYCCQCGCFIEPVNRDFTHLCFDCWINRPVTKLYRRYAFENGIDSDTALKALQRYEYSAMN